MFPRAWRIATMGGVEVRVDPGLIVIALLIAWSFQGTFAVRFGAGPAIVMALAGAVLFFLSVLVHELGHALEARHRGIEVSAITLFLFGGVTEMHDDAPTPRAEFAIAAVGPFLSLVCSAAFGLLATVVDYWQWPAEVSAVFGLLGWLNLGLAVFNLVPGAPLDGGRVLRSLLWWITDDRARAQRGAAWAGQGFAVLVWAVAAQMLTQDSATGSAIWLFLVGWFLWNAARGERAVVTFNALVEGRLAGGLPVAATEPVRADISVSIQVDRMKVDGRSIAPVARDGEVVGAFVLEDVVDMHPQDQVFRLVEEVMRQGDDLPRIRASQPLLDLIEVLRGHPVVLVELADGPVTTLTAGQVREALATLRKTPSLATLPPPNVPPPGLPASLANRVGEDDTSSREGPHDKA